MFVPKRLKIKFDCHYLKIFDLYSEFSEWLVLNTTPALSLTILERLVDAGQSVTVLTLADQITVGMYLSKYLNGTNIDVTGSTAENAFTASMKAEIVSRASESVFFTDSMMDLPAIKVASTVVISEFCTLALRKYANENECVFAGDYE